MPRGYVSTESITGRLRAYFGISQSEMALFLGVSDSMAGHFDTKRRPLDHDRLMRLLPLVQQVPAELPEQFIDEGIVIAEPVPTTPPPARARLETRRRYCLSMANGLRRTLAPLVRKAQYMARWQAALPALLAAFPAPDPVGPVAPISADEPFDNAWARYWFHKRARPLRADEITRWHLLRIRADALEAEAAALTALLDTLPPA